MAIKFKLHPLFIFLGLLLFYYGFGQVFIVYLLCVLLHETGHYLVSKKLGYKLNTISLFPFGASLSGEKTMFTERDEILIAIAGPLVNLILMVLTICSWWLFPETYYYTEIFFVSNLAILLFNLLPVFPLDGGRVLIASMSIFISRTKAIKYGKIIGFIVAFLFVVLFILSAFYSINYTFAIVSIFLILAVFEDSSKCKYYAFIENFSNKKLKNDSLPVKIIAVNESIKIIKLFSKLSCNKLNLIYVLDQNKKIKARITGSEVVEFINNYGIQAVLKSLIN